MGAIRYISRISVIDTDQPESRAVVTYTDKKLFTIGSGQDCDVKIKGMGVESNHLSVKIEGHQVTLKNQGRGSSMIGTYKVPHGTIVPYKSGEGIKLGLSKQVIQIETFRKALAPHEESEAILREAWDKAREAEALVATQRQLLTTQNKQAEDAAVEAQNKAEEIKKAALATKAQILKAAEEEAAAIKMRAEKELVRTTNESNQSNEQKAKQTIEQAKEMAKQIKLQAEKDAEALLQVGKKQAQEQIDAAAKQAHDYLLESKREFQTLKANKEQILKEISEHQEKQRSSSSQIQSMILELKKYEDIKQKAQIDLEIEKKRIRLSEEELQKQITLQKQEKQSLSTEIESFLAHFNKVKAELAEEKASAQKELQRCKQEALEAVQMKEQAQYLFDQHQASLKEIKKNIASLHNEQTQLAVRINAAKEDEAKEREEMRNKLNIEYWKRRELEEKWFAEQRAQENEIKMREKAAKQHLEAERLSTQVQKISQKLQPLISIELTSHMSEEQLSDLNPQLQKIIASTVEQCVQEEYEFRRDNWQMVKPQAKTWQFPLEPQDLKLLGVTTLSFLVILAAVFGFRGSQNQQQVRSISSQDPAIVYSK